MIFDNGKTEVTKYFKVTEKELNESFDGEARRSDKAIDAILKRSGKQRNPDLYANSNVKI